MITFYKRVRNIVQIGDLYRLSSPSAGDVTANQYVSADGAQSVLFGFRHSQQYNTAIPAIQLRRLDEKALYRLEPLDANKYVGKQLELSGAYLMRSGVNLNLRGDYNSTALLLQRIP